jgi:hypothetical protein
LLKQNADKNGFLLFQLFWNGFMKNKKLSLSPDSSGILLCRCSAQKTERIAGRLLIEKPNVSAPKNSPHSPPYPKETGFRTDGFQTRLYQKNSKIYIQKSAINLLSLHS